MVLTAGNLLCGDAGEICVIFGEQRVAALRCRRKNFGVGPAGESFPIDRHRLDACGAQGGGIDERWFSTTTKAANGPLTG